MNTRQFDSSESPRAERMTEEETRAVIQRWQQEQITQGGLTDKPALPDVAEGLNISVPDAHRLLDLVRAEREDEERRLALDQAAEAEQIQLAEEQRRLAEVRRQRAELQREQAEWQRQAGMIAAPPQPYPTQMQSAPRSDFATAFQLIFFIVLVVIAIVIMSQISSWVISPFRSGFQQTSCGFDHKPVPCRELPVPIPQSH